MEWFKHLVAEYIDPYVPKLRKWTNGTSVTGLIVHDSLFIFDHAGGWSVLGKSLRLELGTSIVNRQLFDSFHHRYASALPNVEEV